MVDKPKDCYLVIRYDEAQRTEVISPLCEKCGEDLEEAMFWPGERGYSEYLWQCKECGDVIYDPEEAHG